MATLTIKTQLLENYNVGPEGWNTLGNGMEVWKQKGEHRFVIKNFNLDLIMYDEPRAINVIKKILDKKNTFMARFEFIDYELSFGENVIDIEEFLDVYKEVEETPQESLYAWNKSLN